MLKTWNEIIRTESNDFYLGMWLWSMVAYGVALQRWPAVALKARWVRVRMMPSSSMRSKERSSPSRHRDQPAWNHHHHFLFAYDHSTIIRHSEEKRQYEYSKKTQLTIWLWLFLLLCCLCCSIRSSISNCSCIHQNNRVSHFLLFLNKDQNSESYLKAFGIRLILSHLNGADHALYIISVILYDDNIFRYQTYRWTGWSLHSLCYKQTERLIIERLMSNIQTCGSRSSVPASSSKASSSLESKGECAVELLEALDLVLL